MLTRRQIAFTLPLALAAGRTAQAEEDAFPSRAVKIVTGVSAGGGVDILVRLMSEPLAARWKQPVIVDNRPGASQLIAASSVSKSKADGYTLLVATSTPFIQVKFVQKEVSVEVWRDFIPLTVLGVGTVAMAAAKNAPFNSVAEMIDYGRRTGSRLPYGSWGNGSGGHLIGEGFRAHAKIDLVHVPYKAEMAEVNDLLGGNLSVVFLTHGTAKAQADAGKVKLLAVTGPERFPYLPDVPTFKEQGVPGLEVIGWIGAFAPAAMSGKLAEKRIGNSTA